MSKSIQDTVHATVGFHGRIPDAVTASIVDALQMREAQIEADLLAAGIAVGLDEDEVINTLHDIFSHNEQDTLEQNVGTVVAQILSLSRLLSEQTASLAGLV